MAKTGSLHQYYVWQCTVSDIFDIHGVQQLAMSIFFDGWWLLHYVKSECYNF